MALHIYQKDPKGLWNTKVADGSGDLSSKEAFHVTIDRLYLTLRKDRTYQIRQGSKSIGDLYLCTRGASSKGAIAQFTPQTATIEAL